MTKDEVAEKCGESIYAIWLRMAMEHFEEMDPETGFELARNFIKELLKQNPEF